MTCPISHYIDYTSTFELWFILEEVLWPTNLVTSPSLIGISPEPVDKNHASRHSHKPTEDVSLQHRDREHVTVVYEDLLNCDLAFGL